ncbi:MAG: type II toxin-antitoxin system RelE family toxin [Methanobacteriota archaeon]
MVHRWVVVLSIDAERELVRLKRSGQRGVTERILRGLEALAEDPIRPRPGADIRRLAGTGAPDFRLRIGGVRILYQVEFTDRTVQVTMIRKRPRAYG